MTPNVKTITSQEDKINLPIFTNEKKINNFFGYTWLTNALE
jgi:hypothetical protein